MHFLFFYCNWTTYNWMEERLKSTPSGLLKGLILCFSSTQTDKHDTEVECTPNFTESCFVFFFFLFWAVILHSRSWPIIRHRGSGGPLKSCLLSWAEGRGGGRKVPAEVYNLRLAVSTRVHLLDCAVGIGAPADDISSSKLLCSSTDPFSRAAERQRGIFFLQHAIEGNRSQLPLPFAGRPHVRGKVSPLLWPCPPGVRKLSEVKSSNRCGGSPSVRVTPATEALRAEQEWLPLLSGLICPGKGGHGSGSGSGSSSHGNCAQSHWSGSNGPTTRPLSEPPLVQHGFTHRQQGTFLL